MENEAGADLLIIGGGINGVGIARDAAGRGLKVMLCEQGDLANATSSASSKLIHGGLRYLEYWRFGFVREALMEREVLLKIAPHLVTPARFILPHDAGMRPAWAIEAGLLLYDWLALRRRLARSRRLCLRKAKEGAPLRDKFVTGFAYSDCRVDDSRLAVLNAVDAAERGADIRTRTRCLSAKRKRGLWETILLDVHTGTKRIVAARALVNAAGPWASELFENVIEGIGQKPKLLLVKGSHILVPRLYEGEHCYVLQNEDRRIVFVMPYQESYSLIGTTDIPFTGDPAAAEISTDEIAYLCKAVSRYFRKELAPEVVLTSFSGVRPLHADAAADASAASRDYWLVLDAPSGGAPLLSVLGGKITTYRRLAQEAIDRLSPYLKPPRAGHWTAAAPLPGGDMKDGDFVASLHGLRGAYPWLDEERAMRLARAYGTRAKRILGEAKGVSELGRDFGAGLSQAEIGYMIDCEFAHSSEDILWRRSKLGLHLSATEKACVEAYVAERTNA